MIRLGIVGCGLIGQKRAAAMTGATLVVCTDAVQSRAEALASRVAGVDIAASWQSLIVRPDIDAIIVATTHDALATITLAAISAGKHVLVEKPAARRSSELEPLVEAAERHGAVVRVGFNHRYHRALRKAYEIAQAGDLGQLMFVRGRYGHG